MHDKMRTEMAAIHSSVSEMGEYALVMLTESLEALEKNDKQMALSVIQKNPSLTTQYQALEEEMFRFIAIYQPVAKDMRKMVCSIRLIYNFERIGRMGKDIARMIINFPDVDHRSHEKSIRKMGEVVTNMIADCTVAYQKEECDLILEMYKRDDIVDSLYEIVVEETIRWMVKEREMIPVGASYLIIARLLERCGDQACNIAEMVRYMISGQRPLVT
ncbi:MAG: phosphate signaling complex protein PhoU [Methanospirillaceae archaeon]|nr:phosphate signaling complex protein PhoU [Methanospirillaceae archaeon]